MKIVNSSSEVLRSDQTREVQRKSGNRDKDVAGQTAGGRASRGDRVQISDAGRALAAQANGGAREALSPERVAEVRERILSGAYNSLDVVDQVARKMLASGDI
jgi:negative regulator of flagellin synthesis FlgM